MEKKSKRQKLSCSSAFFYFYLIGLVAFIFIPPRTSNTRYKACYSNQRVLQGAVDMYNMDSSEMMSNLDVDILVKSNYLINIPNGPESQCKYVGNKLDSDGIVYCTYHGDVEGHTVSIYEQNKRKNRIKNYIEGCLRRIPESLLWPHALLIRITTKH